MPDLATRVEQVDDGAPLPELLARVEQATDRKTALKLAESFGGRRVELPARPKAKNALLRALGLHAVTAIIAAIGNGPVIVPLGPTAQGRRTARRIDQMIADGRSVNDIARETGVHSRTVSRRKRLLKLSGQGRGR